MMERPGIFELLDALSALPPAGARKGEETGAESPIKEDGLPPAAPPAGGAAGGVKERAAKEMLPSARPHPEAAADGTNGGGDATPGTARSSGPQALESFLKRHAALAKKAEKK